MANGISVHVGSTALGLGFVGKLLSPAFESSDPSWWGKVSAIGDKLANDPQHQRDLLVLGGGYMAVKSVRSSVEKSPLIQLGKLRIYAL